MNMNKKHDARSTKNPPQPPFFKGGRGGIFLLLASCLPAGVLVAGFLLQFSFSCPAMAETADEAYQSAHDCYAGLQSSPELQKRRDQWETCLAKFRHVASKYGRKEKGADAKFSIGRLYEELAANSKNQADWSKAVDEYESFARQYSRNNMADDAYFRAARIYWEQFGDKRSAVRDLSKVIKFYKTSDTAGEAEKYLDAVQRGVIPQVDAKPDVKKGIKAENRVRPLTIVIDPGHGGSDTGAIGLKGTKEKDVALSISKDLAKELKKRLGSTNVFLTRENDATLTLDDRTKFSNSKNADLFISIHANASTSGKQHGVQTYFLNNATDEASKRLANQENKNLGRKISDIEGIIATMIQTASTDDSRNLARLVHKNLVGGLSKKYSGVNNQGVRSALFYVLVGVKCPSILVETSYISNHKEELRLKDDGYQDTLAGAISSGIEKYLKSDSALAANL